MTNNNSWNKKMNKIVKTLFTGVDRYIKLRAQPNVRDSIIAGIPWHGYVYKCSASMSVRVCKSATWLVGWLVGVSSKQVEMLMRK